MDRSSGMSSLSWMPPQHLLISEKAAEVKPELQETSLSRRRELTPLPSLRPRPKDRLTQSHQDAKEMILGVLGKPR